MMALASNALRLITLEVERAVKTSPYFCHEKKTVVIPLYREPVSFRVEMDWASDDYVITAWVGGGNITNSIYRQTISPQFVELGHNIGPEIDGAVVAAVANLEKYVATTPEGKVKKKVKDTLNELGCYYFSPRGGPYAQNGVPDIIVCHNSRFIGIECKAGKGKPTVLQEKNLADIAKSGGLALVIDETNVDLLKYKIEYFLENL